MSIRRRFGALVGASVLVLAGVLAVPAPALPAPAPADPWGFAFLDNPAPPPGSVMDPTRQWGSWKSAFPADWATVDHLGPGAYRVHFPHLATGRGVAHVTAVLWGGPAWCQLGKWYPNGADETVEVQCYAHGGIPADTRFAISFTERRGPLAVPGGGFGYVYADSAANVLTEYNSTGAANPVAYGGGGFYRVTLPGVGAVTGFAGNVQVAAAEPGKPRRCKVADVAWGGADVVAYVACFDGVTSKPADSAFTLTYHRERPLVGELGPPKRFGYVHSGAFAPPPGTDFNSLGAANVITPSGVGQNMVTFTGLGVRETHAQTTAVGGKPDYCSIQDVWRNIGGNGVVRNVICFDDTGAQAPNPAFVTFTSRV
ncbi:hypothetical protein GCM10009557_82480 [Virgisporangium ochraceum]|uniref:Secreted protein n=1 Tax=Virgisporangium ochraceum TaxID=65505 RepID=A0A8J4A1W3_9ACTN|nr:hypothetical protein [Virgisporangium ochraceum]GIJ72578.1 hypothetical protein Voc01_074950 [Virgisporangium ochraceum]